MDVIYASIGVLIVVFAGGAIGLQLQRTLPEAFTLGAPRDMIASVTGLVTLLLALVLGLLIWTAFGVHSTQKAAIQSMAIGALKFDAALKEYGPEAAAGRTTLKKGLGQTISEIWGGGYDGDFVVKNYRSALANLKARESFTNALRPATDGQKSAQTGALQAATAIGQARMQMALALVD